MAPKITPADLLRLFTPELPDAAGGLDALMLADQLFLENVADRLTVLGFEHQLTAKPVDRLTLFVHHVVVFEDVFTRFEVAAFDSLLCTLDLL